MTKADRYEPELQRSYEEMAAHFGIAVIPARPFRPRDKPKAELTVLLVSRWVLARLRHQRFFSLDELNAAIRPLLTALNERPFQKLPGSRRSVFEALDRPAMRPLPATPYVYAEWKRVRTAFDYHVDVDRHYYSVPHALVGQELWARFSASTVEVFHRSVRVASHVRSYQRGAHTTLPQHMPRATSGACRMDAHPVDQLGRLHRCQHLRGGRASAEEQAPSGARLSSLSGTVVPREAVRAGTTRGGQRLGGEITQPHPQERAVDLEDRA